MIYIYNISISKSIIIASFMFQIN